jgi:tRNA-2-methylthio-N6-dimethylallyladenosine synthase
MNFRDSEFVEGILLDAGFKRAKSFDDADVVLFNTCSVRQHAEDRAYANIWNLKKLKKKRPGLIIGVIGCMAQAKKEKIFEDIPLVDFTCGPDNEPELPRLLRDVLKDRTNIAALDKISEKRKELFPEHRESTFKAYVSISYGCDNFCSYCVVPYVRGRERSRAPKDVLREVKDLAGRGFKEITLLGQNVNSYAGYGGKDDDFVRLLEDVNKIPGNFRIRFITSHPKDASRTLFQAMGELEKLCEHLHLPLQSGSDRILKLMNRGYKARDYLRLVESYRAHVPDGSLSTDIIVGFPYESDKDFRGTLDMMKRVEFDSAYIFKYSPRPFAKASRLKDDVPQDVKAERNILLLDVQNDITKAKNEALVGTVQEVLFEADNPKVPGGLTGRTRTNKIVLSEGADDLIGKFADVSIERATCSTLRGRVR